MILAFDPGDHTGYCVMDDHRIIETGEIRYPQKKSIKHLEELIYMNNIGTIYEKYRPIAVIIEENFMGRFIAVVKALTKKLTLIRIAIKLRYEDALIITPTPSEWKALLDIPQKTKFDQRPEKEKVLTRIKQLIPGYSIDNEHITDAVAMCLAYEGRVRVKL
ncbi:MAG TPA: hypothetical protein PKJ95_04340 [Atribacterota bacterium]|nr:hypothetical protein [Atribacterota bacterium]